MKNVGKIFEGSFKKSVPDYCLLIRIPDPPQSFIRNSDTKFSRKNVCDYLCFQSISQIFYAFELKSTKNKFMDFEDITLDDPPKKRIHKHQIIGLMEYSKYNNVIAGFVFNFRDEKNNMERTYFQNIKDFEIMCQKINKFSFNELDLLTNGGVKISGIKKRVHYQWNLNDFFQNKNIYNMNVNQQKGEIK